MEESGIDSHNISTTAQDGTKYAWPNDTATSGITGRVRDRNLSELLAAMEPKSQHQQPRGCLDRSGSHWLQLQWQPCRP